MIVVSAFYAVCVLPGTTFYLISNLTPNMTLNVSGYYVILLILFFYFAANPFIYAVKFDPVKRVLLRLIPFKESTVQPETLAAT